MSAALVAAQNPELVKSATDMVKTTQSNAMKVFKVVGITIGAGLAGFVIFKIAKKIKQNISLKKDDEKAKKAADEQGFDKEQKTLKDSEIDTIVRNLKSAFDGWTGYDESAIRGELSKLQNKHDWYAVEQAFGVKEKGDKYWRLADWLNDDDSSDRKSYREILDNIQVTGILKL